MKAVMGVKKCLSVIRAGWVPPKAAPNPQSGVYTLSANKRSSFTTITTFTFFMFKALKLL